MLAKARRTSKAGVPSDAVLKVLCAQRLLPRAAWDLSRCVRATIRPATQVRVRSDNVMLLSSLFTFKNVRRVTLLGVLGNPLLSVNWPASLDCLSIEDGADAHGVYLPPGLAVGELDVVISGSWPDGEGPTWIEHVLSSTRAGALKSFSIGTEDFATMAAVPLPAGIAELELLCVGCNEEPDDDHPPLQVPDSVTELHLNGVPCARCTCRCRLPASTCTIAARSRVCLRPSAT
eukprot:TRINITY_DN1538_c0_g1_i1.p1 TRINITY_DN1538_c0_g1~~TRINITY_DN1538_c0_g1_i1.p1  ORF type:complete len:233 (-),score=48.28 TRINITY_DN1538_c0_g1_i1:1039-1737(-)